MKKLMRFFKDEDGATLVEYGLMLALIAIICIVAVGLVGSQANITFDTIQQKLTGANAAAS